MTDLAKKFYDLTGYVFLDVVLERVSSMTPEQKTATYHRLIQQIPNGRYLEKNETGNLYGEVVVAIANALGYDFTLSEDKKVILYGGGASDDTDLNNDGVTDHLDDELLEQASKADIISSDIEGIQQNLAEANTIVDNILGDDTDLPSTDLSVEELLDLINIG